MSDKKIVEIKFTANIDRLDLGFKMDLKTEKDVDTNDLIFFITSLEGFIQEWYDQFSDWKVKKDDKLDEDKTAE